MDTFSILESILKLPNGYSEGIYQNKKYGITRASFNKEKSFKVYAEELGGTDFISLNFYRTSKGDQLKPCEMSSQKVIHFLQHVKVLNTN